MGINIVSLLGIFNLVLVFVQLLGGLRIVKMPFKVHKTCGIVLAVGALAHGLLAFLSSL